MRLKYITIIVLSLLLGASATYGASKLNLVWEMVQTSADIELNSKFYSAEHVKVFKFTDDKINCYVSVSPSLGLGIDKRGYSEQYKTYNTAISCVK